MLTNLLNAVYTLHIFAAENAAGEAISEEGILPPVLLLLGASFSELRKN
jgi:hypothetical protein